MTACISRRYRVISFALACFWGCLLPATAVPSITSVQVTPDPGQIGGAVTVTVAGSDLASGTGFLDLRPLATSLVRFSFAQEGDVWRGEVNIPASRSLKPGDSILLSVVFSNSGGQRTTQSRRLSLVGQGGDPTAPDIAITSPTAGRIFAASPITVTGTTSDDAVSVSVNGVDATLNSDGTWTASVPLVEGSNLLTATARDADGNPGTATRTVVLDTVAPNLSLNTPADGSVVNSRTPTITIDYSDSGSGIDVASVRLLVNAVDVTSGSTVGSGSATYTPGGSLPTGDNQVRAEVKDRAGNTTTRTFRFTVSVFRAIADASPTTGTAPLTVTFRTRGEFTGGSIVRYRWDFENDGVFDTSDSVARDFTHTYAQLGTYSAVLEVLNNLGETATDTAVITVTGQPTEAFIEVIPSNGAVPLPVEFRGFGRKQGGAIAKVELDFEGDGIFDVVLDNSNPITPRPDSIRFKINHANCGTSSSFNFYLNDQLVGTAAPVSGCSCGTSEPEFVIDDPAALDGWLEDGGNTLKVTWGSLLYVAYIRVDLIYSSGPLTLCMHDAAGGNCATRDLCVGYSTAAPFQAVLAVDALDEQYNFSVNHVYNKEGVYNALVKVTDTDGGTATASAFASVVRVGPPGSPSVNAAANPITGFAPLRVNFSGTATDDGSIVRWEWDFDGNGVFDFSSPTSANTSFTYTNAGHFAAALRVTDNDGMTSIDTVEITVNIAATLTVPTDTFTPALGQVGVIRTTISGSTRVRIFIKNRAGTVVRNLVDATRVAGTYDDSWDGTSSSGNPLPHGDYYAVLEYRVGSEVRVLDLTGTTGGTRYNPPRNSLPNRFNPLADDLLTVNFSVPANQGASEIQAFIGLFNTDTRFVTLLERVPFGVGNYTIKWDGTDPNGGIAVPPPGDSFLFGIWGFTLPNNALFIIQAADIANVTVDPNFYDPAAAEYLTPSNPIATVEFDLSKKADIELTVTSLKTGRVVRRIRQNGLDAGTDLRMQWNGRADNGLFVDAGDYRLALQAADATGSQSLVRYALVRVIY